MKVFAVIFLFCTAGHSIPLQSEKTVQEPQLVPDANWNLHLVDINSVQGSVAKESKAFQADRDVVFQLFTTSTENERVQLNDTDSIVKSGFNAKNPTRFLIHGWSGSAKSDVCINIRKAYLEKGNFNVFVVDWSKGANSGYIVSRNRVDAVGKTVANFIAFLHEETGMTLASVTIVGHSLGAHIAGLAGKNMGGAGRIGAIVGLDPAWPLFSYRKPTERLDVTDANYVEVIHTNARGLGMEEAIGHNDFYPNYGVAQPGCKTSSCAHSRSHEYFAESITSTEGFWAKKCDKFSITQLTCHEAGVQATMGGEPVHKEVRGVFLLLTNAKSPFTMGKM